VKLHDADIFVICVHPSSRNGRPGLSELENAAIIVGKNMREDALVIIESVVFPGVCEHVAPPIIEKASGLTRPNGERGRFFFAHAPALAETQAPRIIGASNPESLTRAVAFYRAFENEIVPLRSIKEAEAVRLVEDSLHDASMAVAGEFSILFDRIGIDIVNVLKAIRPDLFESSSLSGIDMPHSSSSAYYLARSGHEHEIDRQFLNGARRVIEYMPEYAVTVLTDALREQKIPVRGIPVALLGLSDKKGVMVEGGVGLRMRDALKRKGMLVQAYDPYIAGAGSDLKETLKGARAAVIASDHRMFETLSPRQFEEFGISIVIDARNCLDKNAFADSPVIYHGIGRGI